MTDPDARARPWLDALLDEVGRLDLFDAHTHIGRNDPDGFRQEPEQLLAASAGAAPAASCSRCTSRTATAPPTTRSLAAAARRTAGSSPSAASSPRRRDARAGGAPRARRGRARDQAAPARRAVHAWPSRRCASSSRSPHERARAGADPRRPRHPRARASDTVQLAERVPRRQADPRPRRDLRPRLAVARAARVPERLRRHGVVEPGRSRSRCSPSRRRPACCGQRLAVRAAAHGAPCGPALARCRPG